MATTIGKEDDLLESLENLIQLDHDAVEAYEAAIDRLDDGSVDTEALATLLAEIKSRMPDEESITLLLEPRVPYEDLVRVMDAVRIDPEDPEQAMFPDIAIGEARHEDPA